MPWSTEVTNGSERIKVLFHSKVLNWLSSSCGALSAFPLPNLEGRQKAVKSGDGGKGGGGQTQKSNTFSSKLLNTGEGVLWHAKAHPSTLFLPAPTPSPMKMCHQLQVSGLVPWSDFIASCQSCILESNLLTQNSYPFGGGGGVTDIHIGRKGL